MDQEVYENAENVGTSMKRRKELPGDGANPRAECVTVYGFAFMYSGSCNELRNRAARHPLSIAHARELTHIASLWNGARIRIHRSIALYPNNTNTDGISGLEMIRTSRLHHCGNHLDFQKKNLGASMMRSTISGFGTRLMVSWHLGLRCLCLLTLLKLV